MTRGYHRGGLVWRNPGMVHNGPMESRLLTPGTCPVTHLGFIEGRPGGEGPSDSRVGVFLVNGIGLDCEDFRGALESLFQPLTLAKHPYAQGLHVALTTPGFEDELNRLAQPVLTMAQQAERICTFLHTMVQARGLGSLVLYGFSYGSDLLVDVMEHLGSGSVSRLILSEINVTRDSCFITSRITSSYEETEALDHDRHQMAYAGFVSRVLKAYTEGKLSSRLMQDMTQYFRTISRKDWHQLARSAKEASADPGARLQRLFHLASQMPETAIEVVLSDPADLRAFQRAWQAWEGHGANIRLFDQSRYEHFHHMGRQGVAQNLRWDSKEVFLRPPPLRTAE